MNADHLPLLEHSHAVAGLPPDVMVFHCHRRNGEVETLRSDQQHGHPERNVPTPFPPAEPMGAVVLRPGDRVLVGLESHVDLATAEEIVTGLRASFPGVEFVVVLGVTALAKASGE